MKTCIPIAIVLILLLFGGTVARNSAIHSIMWQCTRAVLHSAGIR